MLRVQFTSLRKLVLIIGFFVLITLLHAFLRSSSPPHLPLHTVTEDANGWKNGGEVDALNGEGQKTLPADTALSTNQQSKTRLKPSFEEIRAHIQDLRQSWQPPQTILRHWPPYQWYANQDYDPNLWEGFEWENGYYANSGIEQVHTESKPYLPYPAYNSAEWQSKWKGEYVPCEGPRGKLLNESMEDVIHSYTGLPPAFPEAVVGDAKTLAIDSGHCFDRHGRFGPYGNGERDAQRSQPDWPEVRWHQLQDQCLISNRHRYQPRARNPIGQTRDNDMPLDSSEPPKEYESEIPGPHYHHRTALLVRTWTNYTYTENDMQSIRALITELSLLSGGEYQVFLLVNVKNATSTMWSDSQLYQDVLTLEVPQEFQGISLLWDEKLLEDWYPEVGNWKVYWHQFMPVQWFSKSYPEFDFIWNWEIDARYIGNHYHFLEQISEFAKRVPRKYLWERNSRFYIPTAHGTYDEWLSDTHATIEEAVHEGRMDVVWGPQPYNTSVQHSVGPPPPHPMEYDEFEWGVGEEADLITLQPIWDPTHTQWTYRDKIFNFIPGVRPHFTKENPLDKNFGHPDFVRIPRRVYVNTVSRFSRRQLHAMHLENLAGRTMQAEMWPATVALHHGLKAVYAPHPIWTDRRWPAWYMDAVFNADGNETARWSARGDSVYNHDREHNFAGWSWYWDSTFPRVLYRRWLGWSATTGTEEQDPNNPLRVLGGKQFEERGFNYWVPSGFRLIDKIFGGWKIHVGGNGRMCLPPMLLHPIKRVYEDAE